MTALLQDKNIVIYGAGGGMGRGIAETFAREGARLFLTGRTLAPLEAVAARVTAAGDGGLPGLRPRGRDHGDDHHRHLRPGPLVRDYAAAEVARYSRGLTPRTRLKAALSANGLP